MSDLSLRLLQDSRVWVYSLSCIRLVLSYYQQPLYVILYIMVICDAFQTIQRIISIHCLLNEHCLKG